MTPALIFDLDGTLVDTAPDLLAALNSVLLREGRRAVDMADLRHLVGHGVSAMLGEAMRRTGAPAADDRLPALIDGFIAQYRGHIADESRSFPGVPETLAALKAEGARMGVLTNKPQELTGQLLDALDLAGYFAAIHGAGRMPHSKPDPRAFHDIVAALGGPGAGAVMIGDSVTDVTTARAAHAPVIVLSYGYTVVPARTLGADALADAFCDVPALVRRVLALP